MEVTGYELSPAKDGLKEGTGHHHLIIDGPTAFVDKGVAIPMDATHKHYGKAQTEGELELEPGKHKITMQFANREALTRMEPSVCSAKLSFACLDVSVEPRLPRCVAAR